MHELIFDTGLSESAFAKTRLSNLLSESGIAARADKNFGSDMTFSFSEWKFRRSQNNRKRRRRARVPLRSLR